MATNIRLNLDSTSAVKKKNSVWHQIVRCRQLYILLFPMLLFYIVFCYGPMFGNMIAFLDYNPARGILGSPWVGLKHFRNFISDYRFWTLIRNTLSINLYALVFAFPAPIILALLLNEVKCSFFKRATQTITYMPHFISVVVIAVITMDFVSSQGIINSIRSMMGLEAINFMIESKYFYSIYTISGIWQGVGWGSIIYMAALAGIDMELYEAASIDGAGRFKQLIHITLPGIMPTIIILLILAIGQMLTVGYEKIILLYNPVIYEKADVISTYVYRRGILNQDFSFSSAVGFFNSIFNMILLISANYISKKCAGMGVW